MKPVNSIFFTTMYMLGIAWTPGVYAQIEKSTDIGRVQRATAAQAQAILDRAKSKLEETKSLVVEYEFTWDAKKGFDRQMEITMERPNRFRIDQLNGLVVETRQLMMLSDGQNVSML